MRLAATDNGLCFEFVGSNELGSHWIQRSAYLKQLIPPELRSQFRFHGHKPRAAMAAYLARARLVVVPSRWDNYPYTCMEAMASGVPVLATRAGGMAEMIESGTSGWLVDSADPASLQETAAQALRTAPAALAARCW